MKHIIFILFISLMPASLMLAQNIEEEAQDLNSPKDTVSQVVHETIEEDVKIQATYYQELIAYRDSFKVLKDRYLNLEKVYNKLIWQQQSIEDSLRMYKIQCDDAQRQNKSLMDKTIKSDKALISMASNFIYIPYEAYSVDSIAIPAYESVQDLILKLVMYLEAYNNQKQPEILKRKSLSISIF